MKYILTFLALTVFAENQAQELVVNLDYKVVYEIPAPARSTMDTIAISFDKAGKYLYSDAKILGEDFGRTVFENPNLDLSSARSSFILDTEKMEIYFNFSFDKNMMYFKMDLEALIPIESDPFEGNMELISEETGDEIEIVGGYYPSYLLYPNTEPEDPLTLVIDTKRPVNNYNVINEFILLMLRKTESKGSMSLHIPKGLILGVYSKSGTMMEAISIEDVSTTINVSHRFNIKE